MIEPDILSQEIAARALSIAVREAVIRSTKDGLRTRYVVSTLETVLDFERALATDSDAFARMFA